MVSEAERKEIAKMLIKKTRWGTRRNYEAISIEKRGICLVAVHEIGPRIAFLQSELDRPNNILFWDDNTPDETEHKRVEWILYGGKRVWTTRPFADESEEAYAADNGPCEVLIEDREMEVAFQGTDDPVECKEVTIVGAPHPVFKIQRWFKIMETLYDVSIQIVSGVTNTSDMLWSGGLWGLTCCSNPAAAYCQYVIPLPAEKPESGWSGANSRIVPHWAGHKSPVPDLQMQRTGSHLIFTPNGREAKGYFEVPGGWIARLSGGSGGCNFFSFFRDYGKLIERCPNHCNAALYNGPGNFMTEMECMSPWKVLEPGESHSMAEMWVILESMPYDKIDPKFLERFMLPPCECGFC